MVWLRSLSAEQRLNGGFQLNLETSFAVGPISMNTHGFTADTVAGGLHI
jgi:hypothetical protein